MDANGILSDLAEAFFHANLDAVMIGNAAAAIQGAPVTTMDIDFCIEDDETEIAKLNKVASELDANLSDYYPFFQIQSPEKEMFLDFLCRPVGVSFKELFERSDSVTFDGIYHLRIARLEDVIAGKKAAGQKKDLAVIPLLEKTLELKNGR